MAAVTAKKLLTPVTVGGVELQNRVALAPMTRGRAEEDGTPNDMMVEYYRQRGNMGLLISEGACISKQGHGWHYAPGIYNEQHRDGWKKVVEVVHERGGKFAMQLWHLGRQCHSEVTGSPIVAPSPIPMTNDVNAKNGEKRTPEVPQELSEEGIKEIIEDYGKAAELAMAAGCDFVELHAANGYLVDLFIQGKTNQRQDKYGGSIENRLRFVNEVLDRILESVPASKVGIKLSPNGVFGEMGTADNTEVFSALLESLAARKIAFVDFVDGLAFGFHELHPQFTLAMARKILGDKTALFGGCGYSVEDGEKAIESGDGDMIVYGRPTIGNPDFIERIRDGLELAEVPPMDVWYNKAKGREGYVDLERKVPL